MASGTVPALRVVVGLVVVVGCGPSGSTLDAPTVDAAPGDAISDVVPPAVESTVPVDAATAVAADSTIVVVFSETMSPATITTNTENTTCSGSLQVSADDFATCIQMIASPASDDNKSFEITPTTELASATSYDIRVTDSAQDTAGNPLDGTFETDTGFTARYFHPMAIDDTNDFAADSEAFVGSTAGGQIFISHDADAIYVGLVHTDIEVGGGGNTFVVFLFSADATLATGNVTSSDGKAVFGGAGTKRLTYHVKAAIDGADYTEFRIGDGANWDADWGTAGKTVYRSAGLFEASIALTEFGGTPPSFLAISAYTIDYDGDGSNGWLYNMLSGATDGSGVAPRDLVGYVELTLPSSLPPNDPSHLKTF